MKLLFLAPLVTAYTSVFNSVISNNDAVLQTTQAQATLQAVNDAVTAMPTTFNTLTGLLSNQISVCNQRLSDNVQIAIEITTIKDLYEDILFMFGFNYIGTKYHTSGNLIYNIQDAIEECIYIIDQSKLSDVQTELDNSLNIVRRAKSYADIDFTAYTNAVNVAPALSFTVEQARKFETGYQVDLFHRVFTDTWDRVRLVVAFLGGSKG